MDAGSDFGAPWAVLRHDQLDSTNAEAFRLVEAGRLEPCWVLADEQTSGRGRLGRAWQSVSGNLFASALFAFDGPLREAPLVCFAAGLAAAESIDELDAEAGQRVSLKWPNDLVVGERKLGGILIETTGLKSSLVAGFGLNLARAPQLADRSTVALSDLTGGNVVDPGTFLEVLDRNFRARLAGLRTGGFEPLRRTWMERTVHLNGNVSVEVGGQRQDAGFVELAEDGALVVRTDGGRIEHVRAGDVGIVGLEPQRD